MEKAHQNSGEGSQNEEEAAQQPDTTRTSELHEEPKVLIINDSRKNAVQKYKTRF